MHTTMITFSQTGNTLKVARALADGFEDRGHSAHVISLKEAIPEDALEGDLLGVGTPCHASHAPTPIKNYVRSLPALENRPAFVFASSGTCPGKVLYDLTHLLRRKGANVLGGILVRGAGHHPAPCLVGRSPGRPNSEDLGRVRRFALALADHVAAGRSDPLPESRPDALRHGWNFYSLLAHMHPDHAVRRSLPGPRVDPDLCDQCGWCAKECPSGSIELSPYPKADGRCIRCYRCMTGCPRNAFKANWWWGNFVIWTFYNPTLVRWFGDLEPGERIY